MRSRLQLVCQRLVFGKKGVHPIQRRAIRAFDGEILIACPGVCVFNIHGKCEEAITELRLRHRMAEESFRLSGSVLTQSLNQQRSSFFGDMTCFLLRVRNIQYCPKKELHLSLCILAEGSDSTVQGLVFSCWVQGRGSNVLKYIQPHTHGAFGSSRNPQQILGR